jgi:hypothetical protein
MGMKLVIMEEDAFDGFENEVLRRRFLPKGEYKLEGDEDNFMT